MRVGLKVGPTDGIKTITLLKYKPQCAEIWFRLEWEDQYYSLFRYLNKNKIPFGLHFWAMVDGIYQPNLMALKPGIAQKTFEMIKKTINIAQKFKAFYVNFHPESYGLVLLDLDKSILKLAPNQKPMNKKKSWQQLLYYLPKIKAYGDKKGVLTLLETVPKFLPFDPTDVQKGRLKPEKTYGLETEKIIELVNKGYKVCLDIGHTISQLVTQDRKKLWDYLFSSTKKLAKGVRLIHVTTTKAPFNGVDSHNGVLEKDFQQNVMPNKLQLIKLLSIFKNKDVWLIPEPQKGEMVKNFYALKKFVTKINKKFIWQNYQDPCQNHPEDKKGGL